MHRSGEVRKYCLHPQPPPETAFETVAETVLETALEASLDDEDTVTWASSSARAHCAMGAEAAPRRKRSRRIVTTRSIAKKAGR